MVGDKNKMSSANRKILTQAVDISFLYENLSKRAISNSLEIMGLIDVPLKSSTDKARVGPSH